MATQVAEEGVLRHHRRVDDRLYRQEDQRYAANFIEYLVADVLIEGGLLGYV